MRNVPFDAPLDEHEKLSVHLLRGWGAGCRCAFCHAWRSWLGGKESVQRADRRQELVANIGEPYKGSPAVLAAHREANLCLWHAHDRTQNEFRQFGSQNTISGTSEV